MSFSRYNKQDQQFRNAIISIRENDWSSFNTAMSSDFNVNKKDPETKMTLIHLIASFDVTIERLEMLKLLLDKGADPNIVNVTGVTPLMITCMNPSKTSGPRKMFDILLQHHADVNITSLENMTALLAAVSNDLRHESLRLIEAGASIDITDSKDRSLLYLAVSNEDINVVLAILDAAEHHNIMSEIVDKVAEDGYTPLMIACRSSSENMKAIFDELLNAGANANAMVQDPPGIMSALTIAVSHNNAYQTDVLLKRGVRVDVRTAKGNTPLHLACLRKNYNIVKAILRTGRANVNAPGNDKNTPLHIAVKKEEPMIVEALLKMGANIELVDDYGHRPYFYAELQSRQYSKTINELRASLKVTEGFDDTHVKNIQRRSLQNYIKLKKTVDTIKQLLQEAVTSLSQKVTNLLDDTYLQYDSEAKFDSKCGAKMMKQISGTCWLNSTLNIIVLSPALRLFFYRWIMQYFRSQIESCTGSSSARSVSLSGRASACVKRKRVFSESFFVAEVFRKFVDKKHLSDKKVKYIIKQFCSKDTSDLFRWIIFCVHSKRVLDSQIYDQYSDFGRMIKEQAEIISPGMQTYQTQEGWYPQSLIEVILIELQVYTRLQPFIGSYEQFMRSQGEHYDVVVIVPDDHESFFDINKHRTLQNEDTYYLDSAVIDKGTQHVIAAYHCDSEMFIYDSNNKTVFKRDWLALLDQHTSCADECFALNYAVYLLNPKP